MLHVAIIVWVGCFHEVAVQKDITRLATELRPPRFPFDGQGPWVSRGLMQGCLCWRDEQQDVDGRTTDAMNDKLAFKT